MLSADWSALDGKAALRRHARHLGDEVQVAQALADCQIVVAMRERTPFPASLLARLPNLRLLVTTGMRNRSIDLDAARAHGITVCGTGNGGDPAAELAWAGMLAAMRNIPQELANLRAGGPWQIGLGATVAGKRLGIVGLGRLGRKMAAFGKVFDMDVCGWTRSDLAGRAAEMGITPLSLEALFSTSDVIMIQLQLTPETRGMITAGLLGRMKPDAMFVNTARGPLVDESALVALLEAGRIRGAVLDVFSTEPLPAHSPFRRLPNVLATPHIGYVTAENFRAYYSSAVEGVVAWLNGTPQRVLT